MWASQVVLVVKNLPANAGDRADPSLGQEDPLEKEMATHSSILAWRILHDTTEKDPVCPKRPGTAKSIHKHLKKRKQKKE